MALESHDIIHPVSRLLQGRGQVCSTQMTIQWQKPGRRRTGRPG